MAKLNFTDRKKISQRDIEIKIANDGTEAKFTVKPNLTEYNFSPDALIVVEAYRQSQWKQFHCGTVLNFIHPPDNSLASFGMSQGILFRFKVIEDNSSKKLLGLAKEIRPRESDDSEDECDSLLPVVLTDSIGNKIWDIDFVDNGPTLRINKNLASKELVNTPRFIGFTFPEIIRTILVHALLVYKGSPDWTESWVSFAESLGAGKCPTINDSQEAIDLTWAWIEEVSRAFARYYSIDNMTDDWEG